MRLTKRILAPDEALRLGDLGMPAGAELTLRFSMKEALYKALFPLVRRSIPWHSVVANPTLDGLCELDLSRLEQHASTRLVAEARWVIVDDFFLTSASAFLL